MGSPSVAIGGSEMSRQRYSPEFKDEAVRQVIDHGHSVAEVSNLFNLARHLVSAGHYRILRVSAFAEWNRAVA